jgi:hypothetical protein
MNPGSRSKAIAEKYFVFCCKAYVAIALSAIQGEVTTMYTVMVENGGGCDVYSTQLGPEKRHKRPEQFPGTPYFVVRILNFPLNYVFSAVLRSIR